MSYLSDAVYGSIPDMKTLTGYLEDKSDEVNSPPHYTENRKIQPIDVIEDWELDFRLSNVIKYIARYNKKGTPKQDLEKARWYLNRFIERM